MHDLVRIAKAVKFAFKLLYRVVVDHRLENLSVLVQAPRLCKGSVRTVFLFLQGVDRSVRQGPIAQAMISESLDVL